MYEKEVNILFREYMRGNLLPSTFITNLKALEQTQRVKGKHKDNEDMWFRLYRGDTMVTTIRELETDLNLPSSHPNNQYITSCIEIGTSLGNKVEVFFS